MFEFVGIFLIDNETRNFHNSQKVWNAFLNDSNRHKNASEQNQHWREEKESKNVKHNEKELWDE